MKLISIIIPVLNEEAYIERLLDHLLLVVGDEGHEIIVVDGGSTDRTSVIARNHNVQFYISQLTSRASQMNLGAEKAQNDILFFVHADCIPPKSFIGDLQGAVSSGFFIGSYRSKIDSENKALQFNSWLTRFDLNCFRGGDQGIFITKSMFEEIEGFDETYVIMEEYDLIRKAKKKSRFKVIPKNMVISDRKYSNNSYTKVNFINLVTFTMYSFGCSPHRLKSFYQKYL
ncbi:MAG: TIGR04283 family arsenosugar biosynthesis glycosyltransferase [Flavobacteriales bacterium]|nr:TIGR04283 family arsenosugar biosynthesis glycosyltransferase [Flavobacteriales bacterium]